METTPPSEDELSRWQRLRIPALLGLLILVVAARAATRRPDDARMPRSLDVLFLHVAGLRADAVPVADLATDLGVDPASLLVFENTWASSSDGLRSGLSVLGGDLAMDLDASPPGGGVVGSLRGGGYRTVLLDEGDALRSVAAGVFESAPTIDRADALAPAVAALWTERDDRPLFVWVEVGFGEDPLHSDTTEAWVLQERYPVRVRALRSVAANTVRAAEGRSRPVLVVLLGSTGLELGGHPEDPDLPWDSQLHVPFVFALRGGEGLPAGQHHTMVADMDLCPTLLDLLDLPPLEGQRASRSLEALAHGWDNQPPHEALFAASARHVAIRTSRWKLVAPWSSAGVAEDGARLFAVDEDPGERNDLLRNGPPGPIAEVLQASLRSRFPGPGTP